MTPEDAVAAGAMALFGEKYGDEVRVVAMGAATATSRLFASSCAAAPMSAAPAISAPSAWSSEGAVAAGVRRIEAVTGEAARVAMPPSATRCWPTPPRRLKVTPAELPARLAALVEERRRLEREVADLRRKLATAGGGGAAPEVKEIGGVKFAGRIVDDVPARELKPMADAMKQQLGSGVVALVGRRRGQAVGLHRRHRGPDRAVRRRGAGARRGAEAVGGKGGGGRPGHGAGGRAGCGPRRPGAGSGRGGTRRLTGGA